MYRQGYSWNKWAQAEIFKIASKNELHTFPDGPVILEKYQRQILNTPKQMDDFICILLKKF